MRFALVKKKSLERFTLDLSLWFAFYECSYALLEEQYKYMLCKHHWCVFYPCALKICTFESCNKPSTSTRWKIVLSFKSAVGILFTLYHIRFDYIQLVFIVHSKGTKPIKRSQHLASAKKQYYSQVSGDKVSTTSKSNATVTLFNSYVWFKNVLISDRTTVFHTWRYPGTTPLRLFTGNHYSTIHTL